MRNRLSLSFIFAVMLVGVEFDRMAAAEQPDQEGIRFFETHIRPILVANCYDCHSELYAESELKLDSWEGIRTGGKAGPPVIPGKPAQSLLLTAVGYQDSTLQMPPDGKLSKKEIAYLTEWVNRGAPYPGAETPTPREAMPIDLAEERKFWSFQPIADPAVPRTRDAAWPKGGLDQFILARLEAEGLSPAAPADKRTWIRRATFDLTGLPPTVAEIEAFLADDSPDAYERVVDRLLASPAYGERWGRHWLDVARYADSNGLDENVAYGNAWRYRDYVVKAFNDDKPHDRFVKEQLAGDVMPADGRSERHEQLIATGFLSLGPKFLAEVDKVKMEMDIIDEQLDTTGRAFLGLTFGCARCHDHKFDPILTADYYALAGVFKSTKTMESLKTIAMWHEHPIPTAAEEARQKRHEKQVAAKQAEIDKFVKHANKELLSMLAAGQSLPKDPESRYPDATKKTLTALRDELAALKKSAPATPMAMGVADTEKAVDVKIHVRGSHLTLGEIVPRRIPLVLGGPDQKEFPADASGRLRLARWIASPENPLTARVMVNRLWRWHFGTGLVDTPDNFGALGGRPSHPELLDWLARRFIESGWSIKAMHREMMLSSTYRMSSRTSRRSAKIDPENRWLQHFGIRRLEAEEIRDALLAAGGQLNRSMGGSLLEAENHAHIFNHTSEDKTTYKSACRSIYVPVVRNNLYAPFQLFDYADASVVVGSRPTSTVAPQALFFLNSDLAIDSARRLAERISSGGHGDEAGRVDALYRCVLGRPADAEEVTRAEEFLDRFALAYRDGTRRGQEIERKSWTALCQMVLASNEFIFIR